MLRKKRVVLPAAGWPGFVVRSMRGGAAATVTVSEAVVARPVESVTVTVTVYVPACW